MAWPAGGSAGIQNNVNTPRVLATDSVKWTGEGVAAVVADTPEQAVDALEAIVVDWEPLPAVVDAEKAMEPGAPQLHENAPNNVVFEWNVGDKAGTDAAIDGAEVVVKQRIVNQRLIPNPMETRGDIGWYNPGTDEYTVWMSSQTPHIQRLLLTAFVTGIPEHKVRCIARISAGRSARKIFCYADMALCMFASKAIGGRPVKWIEGRRENYQSTIHGRDHITYLEIAGKRDGEVTGLRVKTFANLGGRLSTIGPGIPTTLYARVLARLLQDPERLRRGDRRLHEHHVRRRLPRRRSARGDLRHRAGDGPVRGRDRNGSGGGRGARTSSNPTSSRTRTRPALHTASGGAKIYDRLGELRAGHGQGAGNGRLRRAGGPEGGRAATAASCSASGFSTYIEVCGVAPSKWIGAVGEGWGAAMWESANIRVHLTGKVVVTMGTQPQGQGHETTYAQVVSDRARHPDGGHHRPALGHAWARRSATARMGHRTSSVGMTAAIKAADKVRDKARRYAAHMLEASPDDIEIDGAEYRVKGSPDRKKTIQEIAFAIDLAFDAPEGMEPYLDETAYYDTPNCTWPFGTHIAIVEIDEETGVVELVRYVAVDDVGNEINPLIVAGQLHGGIAQGVGQALWEGAVYSDDGQLLTGSMLDYALPKAVAPAELRARQDGHAFAGESARGQGRRRGRRDRIDGRRRQRGHRRARRLRHPPSRHAVHAAEGLAGDPVGEGRPGMIPAAFDYQRASSLDDALGALAGGEAKVIAGGMSLLPLMKLRLAQPAKLVDIGRLDELQARRADAPTAASRSVPWSTYAEVARRRDVARLRAGLHQPDRRRAGPQPRDHRRVDRPRRSRRRCARRWRSPWITRRCSARQRGERVVPLDGFFHGAFEPASRPTRS